MYNNVYWLSRGCSSTICRAFEDTYLFLTNEKMPFDKLYGITGICRLMFLTDFALHLSGLNSRLQWFGKTRHNIL
jgi:hypothetical protein